jgi:tellurite resistance protein
MHTDTRTGLGPADRLLSVARGKRGELTARREALARTKDRTEAQLELIDQRVQEAAQAALNARMLIARCDGELDMIDAALAQVSE